ncbi:MAG: ParB N-terminal domain-containing protein [Selenomonadaceae bacterium]|nr:ParB N-terminal domain-containing protein [Selenomonadaceae bacterium]
MKVYTLEIDPRKIKLLELNARYMRHEEFKQLVDNIRRDGQLSSTPFLCKESDGKYLCLSGNHRTKAAIEAGLDKIFCLATDDELTQDQKIAIQLSQNAISGQDDPATLKLLYESILDTEMKKYSGLDDKTLELLEKINSTSIAEANLDFKTVQIVFLPDELEAAKKSIDKVKDAAKAADESWLTKKSDYENWLDTQEVVSSSYGVKNVAVAFNLILKLVERNLTQLQEGYENIEAGRQYVPISTVIGRRKIPVTAAKTISKAIAKIQGENDIKDVELWRAIEILAEKYLAGD